MFPQPLTHGLVVMGGSHLVLSVNFGATVEQQLHDVRTSVSASRHKCGATVLTTTVWMVTMCDRQPTCGRAFGNADPSLMLNPRVDTNELIFIICIHKQMHTHGYIHRIRTRAYTHTHTHTHTEREIERDEMKWWWIYAACTTPTI